jgi:hypothetical protein
MRDQMTGGRDREALGYNVETFATKEADDVDW